MYERTTHLKISSDINNFPIAPLSAAFNTCSSPYQARIGSDSSILKNLDLYRVSLEILRRESQSFYFSSIIPSRANFVSLS